MSDKRLDGAPWLRLRGLSRRFPGVLALDGVDMDVLPGEVHALVGENGAGKSTLINILAGVLQPSAGTMELDGRPTAFPTPLSAQQAGISVIFQEFNLLPQLSVAENVFLNREPVAGLFMDWKALHAATREVLALLEIDLDPSTPVSDLSVAQQQLVEIARALSFRSRLIVMDEPTAALSEREVDRLAALVRSLAAGGVSVLYVSHRLAEVFAVADRITVLRDGRHILTAPRSELSEQQVIAAMVGRELVHKECPQRHPGEVMLAVRDLAVGQAVREVSFELRAGEVLALSGLMGSGCTDVVQALFGLQPRTGGEVSLRGKPLLLSGPRTAINSGLAFVPDDRKQAGTLPDLSVMHNVTIGILDRLRRAFWLDRRKEQAVIESYRGKLSIRYSRAGQRVSSLSGGNQQKVILARGLAEDCRVLLLSEPTRGVDVGAKAEIYALIDSLVETGMAVLLQSSELPEILRLANRCLVLASGRPQGELSGGDLNQAAIMALATAVTNHRHVAEGKA